MRKPSRVAVPELSAQNEGVATEVGIEELKANLSRFLQLVQAGNEVLIKDGDTVVARLVHPQRDLLEILPAARSPRELAGLPPIEVPGLTQRDLDEALEWTRPDRFVIEPDEESIRGYIGNSGQAA